jgi:hypothetical protein
VPIALGVWLFFYGVNHRGDEDYEEADEEEPDET